MALGTCLTCKKEKPLAESGKSKGICKVCYKRDFWKPRIKFCKRCERELPLHAKKLCSGCYNSVFHIDKVKIYNKIKNHKIPYDIYQRATKICVICGFDKIVDLHHLDMNHQNNSVENLTGLCPNHHKMIHHRNFQKEVFQQLQEKGFEVPNGYKDDNLFKNSLN